MAEAKKPLGKRKKGPLEMAEFFYSRRGLNVWIFATSLLLTGSCVAMMIQDWDRTWKDYQKAYHDLEYSRAVAEIEQIEAALEKDKGKLSKLKDAVTKARSKAAKATEKFDTGVLQALQDDAKGLAAEAPGDDALKAMIDAVLDETQEARNTLLDESAPKDEIVSKPQPKETFELLLTGTAATFAIAKQNIEFADADQKVARFNYETAKHHYEHEKEHAGPKTETYKHHLEDAEAAFKRINLRLEIARRLFTFIEKLHTGMKEAITRIMAPVKEAETAMAGAFKAKVEAERRRNLYAMTIDKRIRNAPGLDFFGPSVKVLPEGGGTLHDIKDQLNFVQVPKVDRCSTCHMGIANPDYAVLKDAEKDTYTFINPVLQRLTEERYPDAGERKKMTKLFMAHPRLDLYILDSSGHPQNRFGCTVCHQGDGKETDFSLAVHTPSNAEEEAAWKERNDYHWRELWDQPMLPVRYTQSSCRKCHSQQWEIPGAEKYVEGMKVFERAGCYACHKTDTYALLDKHLPKLANGALEETKRVRRPGPPLTEVHRKLDKKWTYNWVLSPRSFRPSTKMPHFFGLSNARAIRDADGKVLHAPTAVEAVQAAAIVEKIFDLAITSESHKRDAYPDLPGGLKPASVERGRSLTEQIGCAACHRLDEAYPEGFKGVNAYLDEFAPNLGNVGRKLDRNWLFAWLKDPKQYMSHTRMPRLRLTDQEAVDITEYMLSLKADNADRRKLGLREWSPADAPFELTADGVKFNAGTAKEILDELVFEQLEAGRSKLDARVQIAGMSDKQKVLRLGGKMISHYGCYACHDVEGWEAVEGIGTELTGAQPWARKFHDRLAFNHTAYDGVSHLGTSFKHAVTGEDYVSRVTGEKEIKIHHTHADFALNKVMQPRVYDAGLLKSKHWSELLRMPNFYLSRKEAEALTTFLLSFTNEEHEGLVDSIKVEMDAYRQVIARGDRIVRDRNCLACHRLDLDRFLMKPAAATAAVWVEGQRASEFTLDETLEMLEDAMTSDGQPLLDGDMDNPSEADRKKRISTYTWTTNHQSLGKPRYVNKENPEGVEFLESNFIYFDGTREWYMSYDEEGDIVLTPVLAHLGQNGGTVLPAIHANKLKQGIDETKLEPRFPPMLRSQGAKTQVDWLTAFLKEPYPIRPNLAPIYPGGKGPDDINIRMPSFDLGDEEASALARYFWARDVAPDGDPYPVTPLPMRDAAYIKANKFSWLEKGKGVPFIKEQCINCHYIQGQEPIGTSADAHKFAPELGEVHKRLRPEWLEKWLHHPAWIYPGTTMTELYKDAGKRKIGVDVLMNMDRLKDEFIISQPN